MGEKSDPRRIAAAKRRAVSMNQAKSIYAGETGGYMGQNYGAQAGSKSDQLGG